MSQDERNEKRAARGEITLTKMQTGALANILETRGKIDAGRRDAMAHVKKMDAMSEAVNDDEEAIHAEIMQAHGIDANTKKIVVNKSLSAFTVEELYGQTEGQQEQSKASIFTTLPTARILGANGRPIDEPAPNSGLDVVQAGTLAALAESGDITAEVAGGFHGR